MDGETVTHIRFGAGRVTAFAPPHIDITFDDGTVKTFVYPQAVGRFIRFTGEAAQRQAQRDREQSEALAREREMAKLAVINAKSRRRERDTGAREDAGNAESLLSQESCHPLRS